jgi:SAM-dependent methyltransferase
VPCGQGFFSYLFKKNGMNVYSTDISEVAISQAKTLYNGLNLFVADANNLPSDIGKFDLIFCRSCSLHNKLNFNIDNLITKKLLKFLKEGGRFIFCYNTNLSQAKKPGWVHHTVEDVRSHFHSINELANKEIYLINKVDTFVFRKFAYNRLLTKVNSHLLCRFKKHGDVIFTGIKLQ